MFSRRVAFAALLLSFILLNTNFYTSLHAASTSKFKLPAMPGITITVTQGNNQGDHIALYDSEYAFDFKVGQTHFVETAAQGGTVIGFNNSSSIQCSGMNTESSPKSKMLMHCWAYANFVLIADDDGTTASLYVHLLPYSDGTNMPKVTCGEHVNQGDPIGLAGTTGYSTGIHLHFQAESLPSSISISHCQQSDPTSGWWWTQSVPVSFSNPEVLKVDANGVPKTDQSFPVSILPTSTPISIPSPTPPTPILVPTPTQPPTPTPTAPSRLQGTLFQAPTTFQVALDITQMHADRSFDGKWFATINGSEEDVIVNGVIVPFNESNRFSQISQDKVRQLQQQFGSDGTLLWFTSTSYDVGQDIWLGSEYYGLLHTNGTVQGLWYPPSSSTEGGTFQLARS